jgi:hypothetical protein
MAVCELGFAEKIVELDGVDGRGRGERRAHEVDATPSGCGTLLLAVRCCARHPTMR